MSNYIERLFQILGEIQVTNTCFSSTVMKSPKAQRSHIAASSAILSPEQRDAQSPTHSGRRQTYILWISLRPNIQPHNLQNSLEQRDIESRRQVPHGQRQELLRHETNGRT